MNWQPIETAPKDNKAVLLYGKLESEIYDVLSTPQICVGAFYDGEWHMTNQAYYFMIVHATHWMPLPPPPKELT